MTARIATLVLVVAAAHAQFTSTVSLTASATPRIMRAEGLTEAAGTLTLQSTSATATLSTGSQSASAVLQVFLNSNVANAAGSSSSALVNRNGAVPSTGVQVILSNFTFPSGNTSVSWTEAGNALSITLQMAANSSLTFGTLAVKGVRVNANQLGPGGQIYFAVQSASTNVAISGATVLPAGTVSPALVGGGSASGSEAHAERRELPVAATGTGQINLVAAEGFSGAFTTMAQETALSGSEVTNGTRLDVVLGNVTAGTSANVYQLLQTPNLTLTLVQNGSPLAGAAAGVTSPVTFSAGSATITYEVTSAAPNGSTPSAIAIPLLLTSTGASAVAPTVTLNLSPVAFSFRFGATNSIPEFAPTGVPRIVTALLLSQNDFVFTAVQGSTTALQQNLSVLGLGLGSFNWTAKANIPSGGSWLSVSAASGSTGLDPSTATPVGVIVNPTGLAAGDYYGVVSVSSSSASNSPQLATVRLRVQGPTSVPQTDITPGGLVFTAAGSQSLTLRNAGGGSLTYQLTTFNAGAPWLSATPTSGAVTSAGANVTVTANPAGLAPGSYPGTIIVSFGLGDGTVTQRTVNVLLLVAASSAISAQSTRARAPATTCSPTALNAISTGVANSFFSPVGWPVSLLVYVSDNCGNPILSAVAIATTPGAPTTLVSLNNGYYSASWTPSAAQAAAITINVTDPPLTPVTVPLNGTIGSIAPNSPAVSAPVNGASFAPAAPVAAGSIVSVFGVNLAADGTGASLPLPTSLGGATVQLGAVNAPFFYAGPGQLNVEMPQELAGQRSASMVVIENGKVSSPQAVLLTPVQPGLFFYTLNGVTRGAILDAQNNTVSPSNPAAAGGVIQVFATGFGATSPAVGTGQIAPSSPPATISGSLLQALIGNIPARIQFSGLAPNFVGLYQFNLAVPSGLPSGDVPLQISANGVASNVVMLAVR